MTELLAVKVYGQKDVLTSVLVVYKQAGVVRRRMAVVPMGEDVKETVTAVLASADVEVLEQAAF